MGLFKTKREVTCCMEVGADDDGAPILCGAPATSVCRTQERNWKEQRAGAPLVATASIPFCVEHYALWGQAHGAPGTTRETFPEGYAQETVNLIIAAMAVVISERFNADEETIGGVVTAIQRAVEAEQGRVFKPVSTLAGQTHKPLLLA